MNLKRIISFNVPLIITLIIFSLYGSITKLLDSYEQSIINDYSIIIVMNTTLNESALEEIDSINLKKIDYIKRDTVLAELKEELTEGSYKMLQNKLPYFYRVFLNNFPTSSQLLKIEEELKTLDGIKSIETFSKDHDDLYSLLTLIKNITLVLFISILVFTFIIINNQVLIWFYEHQERLDIIKLHGGTIFYGGKPIIKLAFFSSLISTTIVSIIIYFMFSNYTTIFSIEIVNILQKHPINLNTIEIGYLFLLSFIISILTVIGVLLKHRIK